MFALNPIPKWLVAYCRKQQTRSASLLFELVRAAHWSGTHRQVISELAQSADILIGTSMANRVASVGALIQKAWHGIGSMMFKNPPRKLELLLLNEEARLYSKERLLTDALITAIYSQDIDLVKAALRAGANPVEKSKHLGAPLVAAVQLRHPSILELLLEEGRELKRWKRWTFRNAVGVALKNASLIGDPELTRSIMRAISPADISSRHMRNAIQDAVKRKSLTLLRLLIDPCKGVDGLNFEYHSVLGMELAQAAHICRREEEVEFVKSIIELAGPENIQEEDYRVPLLTTIEYANVPMVKLFLETYHSIDNQRFSTQKVLQGSIYKTLECLPSLRNHEHEVLEIVKLLVASGAKVDDWKDKPGDTADTALTHAARAGSLELVNYLLEQGADPNSFEDYFTPLRAAVMSGNRGLVRLFLHLGGDINGPSSECSPSGILNTPIWMAIREQNRSMVDLLLRRGAQLPDERDRRHLWHVDWWATVDDEHWESKLEDTSRWLYFTWPLRYWVGDSEYREEWGTDIPKLCRSNHSGTGNVSRRCQWCSGLILVGNI